MPIKYYFDIDPSVNFQVNYIFQILFEGIGVNCLREEVLSEADVIYSEKIPEILNSNQICILADPNTDWNKLLKDYNYSEKISSFLLHYQKNKGQNHSNIVEWDIIYLSYLVLSGLLETNANKDPWGVPITKNSEYYSDAHIDIPVIAIFVKYFGTLIHTISSIKLVPLWPNGKKYAIIISHDVDTPFRNAYIPSISGIIRKMIKNLKNIDSSSDFFRYILYLLSQFLKKIKRIRNKRKNNFLERDQDLDHLRFKDWIQSEREIGTKSAFYVATINMWDDNGCLQDVKYDYKNFLFIEDLKYAIENGWEIGLHGSINAKDSKYKIIHEKKLLENILINHPIRGIRNHYWSLNNDIPELSLWNHFSAGFNYDSSLGLNDNPGFRRGMIWPYNPFDRQNMKKIPIIEIPPTMMDGSIFRYNYTQEEVKRMILDHIVLIFSLEGAVVFNWHLEYNPSNINGAEPALIDILKELRLDNKIFWASPIEVYEWWIKRRSMIENEKNYF